VPESEYAYYFSNVIRENRSLLYFFGLMVVIADVQQEMQV